MSPEKLLHECHSLGRLVKDQVMTGPGDFNALHLRAGVFDAL
jgi:hypothetical protein